MDSNNLAFVLTTSRLIRIKKQLLYTLSTVVLLHAEHNTFFIIFSMAFIFLLLLWSRAIIYFFTSMLYILHAFQYVIAVFVFEFNWIINRLICGDYKMKTLAKKNKWGESGPSPLLHFSPNSNIDKTRRNSWHFSYSLSDICKN